jgi:hypothetical protein
VSGLGKFVLAALLIATPSICVSVEEESKFYFAEKREGLWRLRASTEFSRPIDSLPYVREISCDGNGPDGQFSINGAGGIEYLTLSFMGEADVDGEREEITLIGDHLWLFVDGEKWEYANIPFRKLFTNVEYTGSTEDMVLIWRGYKAVRKGGAGPWLHFSRFQERLLKAKKAEWGYKSRNWDDVSKNNQENRLPKNWRTGRYRINVEPFRRGIAWCNEHVASDAAFQLPANYRTLK